jgi:hypothetical protein
VAAAQVAIAFPVREKFGWALAALRRIYAYTEVPFRLYFIDCGYPAAVRAEIDAFLAGRGNVVGIRASRFLFPNEAVNEAIARMEEPFLSIVQNDVLVHPGYMRAQLEALERFEAEVVFPLTYDYKDGAREMHRDEYTDTCIVAAEGRIRAQQPRPGAAPDPDEARRVEHFELHSLTMSARAAREFYPLPYINTREHIDLAVHAWHKRLAAVHEPRAHVGYVYPPLREYDVDYFRFRWDRKHAAQSHVYIARRWNMHAVPGSLSFVDEHNAYADPQRVKRGAAAPSEADIYEFAVPA